MIRRTAAEAKQLIAELRLARREEQQAQEDKLQAMILEHEEDAIKARQRAEEAAIKAQEAAIKARQRAEEAAIKARQMAEEHARKTQEARLISELEEQAIIARVWNEWNESEEPSKHDVDQSQIVPTDSTPTEPASNADDAKSLQVCSEDSAFLLDNDNQLSADENIPPVQDDEKTTKSDQVSVIAIDDDHIQKLSPRVADWQKLQRAASWVLRFKSDDLQKYHEQNVEIKTSEQTVSDVFNATNYRLRYVQSMCFGVCDSVQHSLFDDEKVPDKLSVTLRLVSNWYPYSGYFSQNQVLAKRRTKYRIRQRTRATKRTIGNCITCKRKFPKRVIGKEWPYNQTGYRPRNQQRTQRNMCANAVLISDSHAIHCAVKIGKTQLRPTVNLYLLEGSD